MDSAPHDRLCSWLGLPPGSWPPDHYALLGLPRGSADVADIELRVLERMERLRAHQLLHPELVTEGMNRLAQALVCLTDPVDRAAYDRSLGLPPPPFEAVEDGPEPEERPDDTRQFERPAEVPFAPGLRPPDEAPRPAYEVVWEPEPEPDAEPEADQLPYEVVPDEEAAGKPLPLPPAYEVVEDEAPRAVPELVAIPVGSPQPVEAVEPLELPRPMQGRVSRRGLYRQLAAVRKALRAWEALRAVYGTPSEALATPVVVLLLVRALAEAREALPGVAGVIGGPGSPGGTVAALVRLPQALHAVRTLLPSQRQAVARDWQRGLGALRREQVRLREMAAAARPRRGTYVAAFLRAARRTPEWVLLLVSALTLVLAIVRRNS